MPNTTLGFGEVVAGGIILLAGLSGKTIGEVMSGQFSLSKLGTGGGGSISPTTTSASGHVTGADLTSIGSKHGWSGSEIADWMKVINQESGGNPKAVNPSSGASGIAQFINGFGEYAQYGGNANTVSGQLTAMANYISQRYGSPSAAWQHEVQYGWY